MFVTWLKQACSGTCIKLHTYRYRQSLDVLVVILVLGVCKENFTFNIKGQTNLVCTCGVLVYIEMKIINQISQLVITVGQTLSVYG